MLATKAAARKVFQGEGRRRFVYSRRNGMLLSMKETNIFPLVNDAIVTAIRSSSSNSIQLKSNSGSASFRKDDLSNTHSFSGRLSVSPATPESRIKTLLFHHQSRNFGLSIQSADFMSCNFSRNRRNSSHQWDSKMHFYPQYESRVFLSTSPPSSSSSDKTADEKPRQKAPGFATHAKIPIPKSSPTLSTSSNPLTSIDLKAILKGSLDMTLYLTKSLFRFIIHLPGNTIFYITNPKERREKIADLKESIKKEVDHYWVGIKVSLR